MTEPRNEHEAANRTGSVRFRSWIWEVVMTWGPAILTVLLIRSVVAEPFRIPSGSMVPTLEIGDHILVTKYSYGFRIPLLRHPITELESPERGDVVVFVFPESDDTWTEYWFDLPAPPFKTYDYVKRVMAIPGDTIKVDNNVVYINDEAQTRSHVSKYDFVDDRCRSIPTRLFDEELDGETHSVLNATRWGLQMGDYGPTTVPEGHVFVMGDNRDHSADSRVWGLVPFRNIKGKARFIWLSYDKCAQGLPLLGELRTDRFGIPVK